MEKELQLVEGYIETGQLEKGLEILNRLMEEESGEELFYLRGYIYYCGMDYDRAIEDLIKVTELNPSRDEAYYFLSQIYSSKENLIKAREFIRLALGIDPENEDYIGHAIGYEQSLGNNEEVIKLCNRLLMEVPDSNFALNVRGSAYLQLHELDKAEADFVHTTRENPLDILGWNNLGSVYLQQGKINEAGKAIQKSLSHNPQIADTYVLMGKVLKEAGKLDKAMEFYDHAQLLDNKNIEAVRNKADLYIVHGEIPKAKLELEKALTLVNEESDVAEIRKMIEELH